MSRFGFTFLLLFLVLVQLSGCGSSSRTPPYSFCMMNRTGKTCQHITLHWRNQSFRFPAGSISGISTMSFYYDPIPEKARVSWTTVDGESGEAEAVVPQPSLAEMKNGFFFCFVVLPDHTLKVGAYTKQEYYDEKKGHELARNGGPAYVVRTKNASEKKLTQIQVFFGGNLVNGSQYQEIDAHTSFGNWGSASVAVPYPVTETARVEWTTPDGVQHKQELDLKHRPRDLNGVSIVFIIDQHDKAHVRFLPWDDWKKWQHKDLLKDNPAGR